MTELPPLILGLINEPDVISIALGGSRSRGHADKSSDYDLFIALRDEAFDLWRNDLPQRACSWDETVIFASFDLYKPGWGHLYGILTSDYYFDVGIVPVKQIDDLGILPTNKIIKDSSDKILEQKIRKAQDSKHNPATLLLENRASIEGRFLIDCYRFNKAALESNVLLMVRYLHFLRNSLIMCYRIEASEYGTVFSIPEKGHLGDSFATELSRNYCIDSKIATLITTYNWLATEFIRYSSSPEKKAHTLREMASVLEKQHGK